MALTPKEELFLNEYLVDLNVERAALAAGYSKSMAKTKCYLWVSKSEVKPELYEAIQKRRIAIATKLEITQEDVLREFWNIAKADPNELIEYRVACCRCCWGKKNRYQYTKREFEHARIEHEKDREAALRGKKPVDIGPFDEAGGKGFNGNREPNPKCEECFGNGRGRAVFKDSTKVSAAAKSLYAGVKITKDGLEMQLHSKMEALNSVAKHLGLFKEKDDEKENDDTIEEVVERMIRFDGWLRERRRVIKRPKGLESTRVIDHE